MSSTTKKANNNPTNSQTPKVQIPAAALKRFANDLEENINIATNKNNFLQLNHQRIQEFITKDPLVRYIKKDNDDNGSGINAISSKSTVVPGILEYPKLEPLKSIIALQKLPEFNSNLGTKSRFGEGDGSFFDHWLSGETTKSKHLHDKDGFPIMDFALCKSPLGFKRKVELFNKGQSDVIKHYVKPYAERREERLKREKEGPVQEEVLMTNNKILDDLSSIDQTITNNKDLFHQTKSFNNPTSQVSSSSTAVAGDYVNDLLPLQQPVLSSLSLVSPSPPSFDSLPSIQKQTYFGYSGRQRFFDCYRELSREYMTTGNASFEERLTEYIDVLDDYALEVEKDQQMMVIFDDGGDAAAGGSSADGNTEVGIAIEGLHIGNGKKKEGLLIDDSIDDDRSGGVEIDRYQEEGENKHSSNELMVGDYMKSFDDESEKSANPTIHGDDKQPLQSSSSSPTKHHRQPSRPNQPLSSLASPSSSVYIDRSVASPSTYLPMKRSKTYKPSEGESNIRPKSARSKFLLGCISQGISPHPSLIIRKHATVNLCLSNFTIGDKVGIILSECLETLPLLQGLAIDDNNLTDKSLVPIIKALSHCPMLKSFNISRNKVDSLTANALLDYLSSSTCNLIQLIMSTADIDDHEASRFILAITNKPSLTELDLSRNLIGSHEFTLKKNQDTGGIAIGKLLTDSRCCLQTLKLSWNMIRLNSGIELARSIKVNQTLTYLDLSYNGLSVEGSEILGDALHSNHSLITLNVCHNNITCRPAFVILSGALSCSTLKYLDISRNPIGEIGARALLVLNLYYGDRISVDIKGCSLIGTDPSCWYDSSNLLNEYIFNLDKPYDRSACIELLRYISSHDNCTVSSLQYTSSADQSIRMIELSLFDPAKERNNEISNNGNGNSNNSSNSSSNDDGDYDEIIGGSPEERRVAEARRAFKATSSKLFKQYDFDGSGELDKDELMLILEQLGIDNPSNIVASLLRMYDLDGSGAIEEDEFHSFMMTILTTESNIDTLNQYHRYLYSIDEFNQKKTKSIYIPPDTGKISIKINVDTSMKGKELTISMQSIASLMNSSKSAADSTTLYTYALNLMKLKFTEAVTFYRILLKEVGNVLQVVQRVLPRMATAHDTRLFLNYVTHNDFIQLHTIREELGLLFYIYIGIPNAFYRLNLSDENDRNCLLLLIEMNNNYILDRKNKKMNDTSQHGNNCLFRNIIYDNKEIKIISELFENPPMKGKIEFDFMLLRSDNVALEKPISNLRLFKILVNAGLVKSDRRKRFMDLIQANEKEGLNTAKCNQPRNWTINKSFMTLTATYLDRLYQLSSPLTSTLLLSSSSSSVAASTSSSLPSSPRLSPRSSLSTTSATTSSSITTTATAATTQPRRCRSFSPISSIERPYYFPSKSGTSVLLRSKTVNSKKGMSKDEDEILSLLSSDGSLDPQRNVIINDGSFIKEMLKEIILMNDIIAERILEFLENTLAGRYLTCAQLAMILDRFPDGNLEYGEYGTYRVMLIISLFPNIVDLINIDMILKDLSANEVAMLIYRVGWLNLFNPMKIEGFYTLNLRRWEEKQMFRLLIVLNFIEIGPNWHNASYQFDMNSEIQSDWNVPTTWLVEPTLPNEGIISLKYTPEFFDLAARHALMPVVLSEAYREDYIRYGKPTIDSTEALFEKLPIQLSFVSDVQKKLCMKPSDKK